MQNDLFISVLDNKTVPTKHVLKFPRQLYMYNGNKSLCKWMPDGEKLFSHSWSGNLQFSGRSTERPVWVFIRVKDVIKFYL